MTKEQLLEALAEKIAELRKCYSVMTVEQMRSVADWLRERGWA